MEHLFSDLYEITVQAAHPQLCLEKWPAILKERLGFNRVLLYYRISEGGVWKPYSSDIHADSLPLLKDDHTIIESFTSIRDPLILDSASAAHFTLVDRDFQGLLSRESMNLIIPLRARRFYRGLCIASLPHANHNLCRETGISVQRLLSPLIGLLEAEELDMQRDRNYYRLFQFDRLVLLGKMAASLAHELRTPLATVLFEINELADLLAGQAEAETCRAKIIAEVTRASKLIESLLVFSKFKEMEVERIDLGEFIPQAIRELPTRKLRSEIQMTMEIEPGLCLKTDGQRLRQVLFNVIFNAIEAIPGGGEILIKAYRQSDGGRQSGNAVISLRDTGPGIPDDLKERVLEPFFTTKKEGTGLGLYIVYGIMKTLKGDLEIQSSPSGTRVDLIFPGEYNDRKNDRSRH